MPLDVSQLSAYPQSGNTELEQWKAARQEKWDRARALADAGDAEGVKTLMAELRQEAEDRYRAMHESERR